MASALKSFERLNSSMRILVCTDGSERGQKVLALAATIAAATGAATTILGITELEAEEERLQKTLERAAKEFRTRRIEIELVTRHGDPVDEILEQVKNFAADLVIIGAEQKRAEGHFRLSAKAYSIVSMLPVPVLLVRRVRLQLKRFLICSGGGSYIENAVRFTAELARSLGSTVTLLNVVAEPPAMHAGLVRREEDTDRLLRSGSALGRNLLKEKKMLEEAGVSVEVRVRHGIVIDQILKEMEQGDHDLVIVGSFPEQHRMRQYVIGNLTREIVNRCERPILVIRSDKKATPFFGFLTRRSKKRPAN